MPETFQLADAEFSAQMEGLIHAAEKALESRGGTAKKKPVTPSAEELSPEAAPTVEKQESSAEAQAAASAVASLKSIPEMLKPLVQGIQAVGRTCAEQSQVLARLEKAVTESAGSEKQLPKIATDLQQVIDQRNIVSRQMFDALYEELRTYKDGFLLDSVHKPMIRDLITLFDDLVGIHRQTQETVADFVQIHGEESRSARVFERIESLEMHLEHNLEFILEVLARLEVTQMPKGVGKLDKHSQRAVAVEMAEDPDDDLLVVRTVKRGFMWKDRVLRPEEVVIKKWKEGFLVALQ